MSTPTERRPIYYAFGNHMHWADMEWLWGYHVLPDSIDDMVRVCAETGAHGHINFDAIAYEKLASEAPQALDRLRAAVAAGTIEVVGGSYGQPYGLFHGGESNVRQLLYGVRTVERLLDVRPRLFWEEEFYFFPQLPQLLAAAGYTAAALFFKETWHTPFVPKEETPVIHWEGMDGSRLPTLSRNTLNVRQWPEEFRRLRARLEGHPWLERLPVPLVLQWLELMPSRDWMCRSDVILPEIRALIEDPRYEVRFTTLSSYVRGAAQDAPVRRYTLDDVFHGMSIGKNGDLFRRLSRQVEGTLLSAESLSAVLGIFGRPYASWDLYPVWELEEAWRELLSAQHHDNEECEGLCGHVGRYSYVRSQQLAEGVLERGLRRLAQRVQASPGDLVVFNPLGWPRAGVVRDPHTGAPLVVSDVPAFGYCTLTPATMPPPVAIEVVEEAGQVHMRRGAFAVTIDRASGAIVHVASAEFPNGALRPGLPLATFAMIVDGEAEHFATATEVVVERAPAPHVVVVRRARDGAELRVRIGFAPELDALDLHITSARVPRSDSRMAAALHMPLTFAVAALRLIHDHPYGVSEIRATGSYRRKYPTGDWMTSPQVYEEVRHPFTALHLLDFMGSDRGVLLLHDGSQGMLRDGDTVRMILSMHDAWDEDYFVAALDARIRFVPHSVMTHATRWRLAQEFLRGLLTVPAHGGGDLPAEYAPLACDAPNVVVTALYREAEAAGTASSEFAGRGMGYPYVLRLIELDGVATEATLDLPGRVVAYRTDLLGERPVAVPVTPLGGAQAGAPDSRLRVSLRPYEIATLYADLELGRKVYRDLDGRRTVWAGGETYDR